ncbi:hypothetical protein EMPS_01738 [Entomortierella parvispora]|uniref:Uncharacterized protein n=1 Tax=Entomortierella parvispora TaxID=205924 RepID=A0A9P3H446_9FUNG|nr:hypothetical protein EMPS_01738 [Entomortierella parvispora]
MEERSKARRKSMFPVVPPGPAEKRREFLEYFSDPPNAVALLANGLKGISLAEIGHRDSAEEKAEGQAQEHEQREGSGKDVRFSMLRHRRYGENQAYILVAVQFLIRQFEELLTKPWESQMLFALSRGKFFESLAKKLEKEEPVLRRVSGPTLRSMFERVVQKYEDLQNFKRSEPGGIFATTILMDKVGLMYRLHQHFVNAGVQMASTEESADSEEKMEGPEPWITRGVNAHDPGPSSSSSSSTAMAKAATHTEATVTATSTSTTTPIANGELARDSTAPDDILEEALSQLSDYRKSIVQALSACIADSNTLSEEQNNRQSRLSVRVDAIEKAVEAGRQPAAQATEQQWAVIEEQSRQLMVLGQSVQFMSAQVQMQSEAINTMQASTMEILRRLQ